VGGDADRGSEDAGGADIVDDDVGVGVAVAVAVVAGGGEGAGVAVLDRKVALDPGDTPLGLARRWGRYRPALDNMGSYPDLEEKGERCAAGVCQGLARVAGGGVEVAVDV